MPPVRARRSSNSSRPPGRPSACQAEWISVIVPTTCSPSPSTAASTKSAIGHLLGAAGAVEAIYSILAVRDQVVPPTLNLDNPSEGCDIDLVPHQAKERPVRNVMSNSFGFGGTNATLVFSAFS